MRGSIQNYKNCSTSFCFNELNEVLLSISNLLSSNRIHFITGSNDRGYFMYPPAIIKSDEDIEFLEEIELGCGYRFSKVCLMDAIGYNDGFYDDCLRIEPYELESMHSGDMGEKDIEKNYLVKVSIGMDDIASKRCIIKGTTLDISFTMRLYCVKIEENGFSAYLSREEDLEMRKQIVESID